MREFARLFAELDETTATNRKLEALQGYFSTAAPENAAWAVYFLAGGKPRQAVPTKLLRQYAIEYAVLDEWLFDESYHAVGDMAETIAHILPPPTRRSDVGLAEWMMERIGPLRGAAPEVIREALFTYWDELTTPERFLFCKLIGGGFRVGVSKLLVTRALANIAAVDSKLIAQRLMGWTDGSVRPTATKFLQLIAAQSDEEHKLRGGQPYPFFLAHQLQGDPAALGELHDWQVEWKYDGIRAQLVRRGGQNYLWSRGEDLISERFPELCSVRLPEGTVVDGEVLVWDHANDAPAPFAELQRRIGRKSLSAKLLAELPAVLVCYDLLELDGVDLRQLPQHERRALLETQVAAVNQAQLKISPVVQAESWEALAALRTESRNRGVEGMMVKAKSAQYGVGRTKDVGTWWKWKVDPYSIDAVLIYAQAGHGRRASLYTDYTFAVWDDDEGHGERRLVPFAKAYSGLTDAEIAQVDNAIRKTTIEKFGPVRAVKPTMVFEIGFEGIALSSRHKAGIAVRFPRILRRRDDKTVDDADTLDTLKGLLAAGV
ncbi:ATP-dependent DNA ligase [Massilia sp. Dwa41.01b]|uniref:ATP-dependent DNA ligase n=1 Tax=unclassified Massilia TaxID=2609279 RepID=UPI0015FFF4AC|nr:MULTISPECIES: ATP-dependent DNA ligase [unclassified Massilia]QNA89906.1 ATP-dependent DNA ligase [Massilia sp. Dwa41.01b]QNB00791.1 ATP-dependent DNA ligase [Massilia sp. Se16.2.3]